LRKSSFQHILRFEDEYRVIVPNYPFHINSIAGLVEGIVRILDEEGIRQAHVLGGSYGGMIAQRLVRRYPEGVARLIISHTGGPEPERAHKNKRLVHILRFLPFSILRSMLKAATGKSMRDAPAQRPSWEVYTNEVLNWLCKPDIISRYEVAVDFDATSNFTSTDLQDWPGRILILEGDNDPIAGAGARAALKALHPQARVHTFQGTGHVASIARVDEYVSVIKDFLKD
jgi:pimeloyl-ACP methyl ester carboxylesterase